MSDQRSPEKGSELCGRAASKSVAMPFVLTAVPSRWEAPPVNSPRTIKRARPRVSRSWCGLATVLWFACTADHPNLSSAGVEAISSNRARNNDKAWAVWLVIKPPLPNPSKAPSAPPPSTPRTAFRTAFGKAMAPRADRRAACVAGGISIDQPALSAGNAPAWVAEGPGGGAGPPS